MPLRACWACVHFDLSYRLSEEIKVQKDVDWLLLKKVSRSFYLTLRLLPVPVRETISLAYLLARLSDTEADGAETDGERELLARKLQLLEWLKISPDREEIETVWSTIKEGQRFDGERFASSDAAPRDPLSREELERYTYLVAGCVGEFWTRICAKKLPNFSWRQEKEMNAFGIRFGQGLQLVNILRDRESDARLGRSYLSTDSNVSALAWARDCLADGEKYCRALRFRRLRAACALPLLLGRETLDLLEREGVGAPVKVSRRRVWVLFFRALVFQDHRQ